MKRSSPLPLIDDLDRPLSIPQLAIELTARGEPVHAATLYRAIERGQLAYTKVGRIRSTLRAYLAARVPQIPAAPTGKGA